MTQISKEYAAALFSIAVEKGCVPSWERQLNDIGEQLRSSPDYVRLLSSPDIPPEERVKLLREAFAGGADDELVSFAALMCRRGRAALLPEAIERFCQLADERARVRVATVELQCLVDPSLIGGLRVTVDGRVIDGSVRERLREIKEVIGG